MPFVESGNVELTPRALAFLLESNEALIDKKLVTGLTQVRRYRNSNKEGDEFSDSNRILLTWYNKSDIEPEHFQIQSSLRFVVFLDDHYEGRTVSIDYDDGSFLLSSQ